MSYNIREEDIVRIIKRFLARLGAKKDSFLREYAIYKDPVKVVKVEYILKEYGLLDTEYGKEILELVKRIEKAKFIRILDNLERLASFTASIKLQDIKKLRIR